MSLSKIPSKNEFFGDQAILEFVIVFYRKEICVMKGSKMSQDFFDFN